MVRAGTNPHPYPPLPFNPSLLWTLLPAPLRTTVYTPVQTRWGGQSNLFCELNAVRKKVPWGMEMGLEAQD